MQLEDVLELGVREGVRRYIEKRAGILLPLAVGAMLPGIVHKALERKRSTEQTLDRAAYNPMKMAAKAPQPAMPSWMSAGKALGGGHILGAPGGGVASGLSKMIERKLFGREFGEQRDPLHMGGTAAVTQFGKEMGTTGANLLRDIANKAMEAAGHAGDSSAREAIISNLKRTDSVLANADDKTLMEAYHTMARFAPVLSTDKNAVRSFLRQAVMSGSGPDYMSIKLLADSERAVTGEKDKR